MTDRPRTDWERLKKNESVVTEAYKRAHLAILQRIFEGTDEIYINIVDGRFSATIQTPSGGSREYSGRSAYLLSLTFESFILNDPNSEHREGISDDLLARLMTLSLHFASRCI